MIVIDNNLVETLVTAVIPQENNINNNVILQYLKLQI